MKVDARIKALEKALRVACYRVAQGGNMDGTPENHQLWRDNGRALEKELLQQAILEQAVTEDLKCGNCRGNLDNGVCMNFECWETDDLWRKR